MVLITRQGNAVQRGECSYYFYHSNEMCVKDKGLKVKLLSAKEGKAKGQCYTSSLFNTL